MSATRLHARRFQFGLIAISILALPGQALAESGEQWRPAGVTRPANRTTKPSPAASQAWQQSDEQSASGAVSPDDDGSNPLRKKESQQAKSEPAEPRSFQPANNVKRIAANSPATPSSVKPKQSPGPSSAVATRPAAMPAKVAQNQSPSSRNVQFNRPATPQPPAHQRRPTQAKSVSRANDDVSDTMWDAVTVAFQSEPTNNSKASKSDASESLPAPSSSRVEMQQPVMRHIDSPNYIEPYSPYGSCGPDGCCGDDAAMWDGGCCQPACGAPCGCGEPCGCDPGCGCEPGCGCDNCNRKDLFCIGPGDDDSCHTVRLRWPKWQEVMIFAGAQGFKGPYDQARDSGNFGFNEGFNIGAKVPYCALGYQFGYRGVQSQLNGDKDTGASDAVIQHFVTVGVFHRQAEGLQFGVVWDGLSDERGDSQQFHQVRSEISVINCQHEFGLTGVFSNSDHSLNNTQQVGSFEPSDQYLLFYRLHGCKGGEGRIFAGFNDDSDGIIGSDMFLPLSDRFSVQSGFTYLIPSEDDGTAGATQEAWNVGVGLVWHWDRQARKCFNNCYRPMFNVADNGTMIIDQNN
jgi:hypothetical protein